jgi:DNA polymerase III gamma/tau subunit
VIFCTSIPEKVDEALKSRCSIVWFSPLSTAHILQLVRRVVDAEGVKIDRDVMADIAEVSNGNARTALRHLEQIIPLDGASQVKYLANNKIMEDGEEDIINLVRAFYRGIPWDELMKQMKFLKGSPKVEVFRNTLLSYGVTMLSSKHDGMMVKKLNQMLEPWYDYNIAVVQLGKIYML